MPCIYIAGKTNGKNRQLKGSSWSTSIETNEEETKRIWVYGFDVDLIVLNTNKLLYVKLEIISKTES